MIPIVTGTQMQAYDAYTIHQMGVPSMVLMERAALALVSEVEQHYNCGNILVVCGSGNNAADGIAAARILHLRGYRVSIYVIGDPEKYTDNMKQQCEIARNYLLNFVKNPWLAEYTVVIDAIFGVGLSRPIVGKTAEIIEELSQARIPVVACDIPSGIDAKSGKILGTALRADGTVTFSYGKTGLYLADGQRYAGKVTIAEAGIYAPREADCDTSVYLTEKGDLKDLFERVPDGNKGTFGKVLLIAGSDAMCGAAYLAGTACMRSGSGMLKIYTAEKNRDLLLMKLPEAMFSTYTPESICPGQLEEDIRWADVVGIGPGISTSEAARMLLHLVIQYQPACCVMDADALTLLHKDSHLISQISFPCVITPHLGEMSRLLEIPVSIIKEHMVETARAYAKRTGFVCVCKDARTVTAYPDGRCYINTSGCSGMATAGSGDVLTGMILGNLAKSEHHGDLSTVFKTVYQHGLLGEYAAAQKSNTGMTSSDMLACQQEFTKELEDAFTMSKIFI